MHSWHGTFAGFGGRRRVLLCWRGARGVREIVSPALFTSLAAASQEPFHCGRLVGGAAPRARIEWRERRRSAGWLLLARWTTPEAESGDAQRPAPSPPQSNSHCGAASLRPRSRGLDPTWNRTRHEGKTLGFRFLLFTCGESFYFLKLETVPIFVHQ
jgi:hypothetical protein